jgi:NAD(P)-dependent dehydrogenase (short-subunit alcohol dehydrogenase family)
MLSSSIGVAAADFLPVVCDVTKEAEVVNLPKIITKHWPDAGIDVLVNNAGAPGEVVVDDRCMWLVGWLAGWYARWLPTEQHPGVFVCLC